MTGKYRRMILFSIILIVIVIIIDLVFNFHGIFMENYTRYVKSQENFGNKLEHYQDYNGDGTVDSLDQRIESLQLKHQAVQAIVNKKTGKMLPVTTVEHNFGDAAIIDSTASNVASVDPPVVQFIFGGQALTVDESGATTLSRL